MHSRPRPAGRPRAAERYAIVHADDPSAPVVIAGREMSGPLREMVRQHFRCLTGWSAAEARRRGFILRTT